MATSTGNEKANLLVLNYHDAVLYQSDLTLLECPDSWWNDACLHFGLTHLKQHRQERQPQRRSSQFAILDPSVVSFLMQQCDDDEDLQEFYHGNRELLSVRAILVPINDNYASAQWQQPGLGTHWSLLSAVVVADSKDSISTGRQYWHFDSIANSNYRAAKAVMEKLEGIFGADQTNHESAGQKHPTRLVECRTPQQANGFDCGVHTLIAARVLTACLLGKGMDKDESKFPGATTKLAAVVEKALKDEFATGASRTCQDARQKMAKEARRCTADYANQV